MYVILKSSILFLTSALICLYLISLFFHFSFSLFVSILHHCYYLFIQQGKHCLVLLILDNNVYLSSDGKRSVTVSDLLSTGLLTLLSPLKKVVLIAVISFEGVVLMELQRIVTVASEISLRSVVVSSFIFVTEFVTGVASS